MENLLKIKSIGLTKLNNSEYTNFMRRVEEQINSLSQETLGLTPDFLNNFTKNLRLMDDIVAQSKIDSETRELSVLDVQRDSIWGYIYVIIDASSRLAINCPAQEAGIALLEQVKPYKKLHQLPNMQETQQIRSLMTDLQKPQNAPHLSTLNLTSFVQNLYALNELYASLTNTRTNTRLESKLPESKEVRLNIDRQYQYMTDIVFAKNITTPDDSLSKFINLLNKIIEEANTAYNQRTSHKKEVSK